MAILDEHSKSLIPVLDQPPSLQPFTNAPANSPRKPGFPQLSQGTAVLVFSETELLRVGACGVPI